MHTVPNGEERCTMCVAWTVSTLPPGSETKRAHPYQEVKDRDAYEHTYLDRWLPVTCHRIQDRSILYCSAAANMWRVRSSSCVLTLTVSRSFWSLYIASRGCIYAPVIWLLFLFILVAELPCFGTRSIYVYVMIICYIYYVNRYSTTTFRNPYIQQLS
jgi:hypothetical protein